MTNFSCLIFSLLLGPANAKSHLRLDNDNDSLKDAFLRMSNTIASSTSHRGAVLGYGRLQNEKSQKCLDVKGTTGRGNVLTWDCLAGDDQTFTLYENGELVNSMSGECLDIEGNDGSGDIGIHPCNGQNDQKWTRESLGGNYFSLASKESNKCVDVWGNSGDGNIGIWDCENSSKQRWRWITEFGYSANIEWALVGCHNSENSAESAAFTVERLTSSVNAVDTTMAMEIGASIEAAVGFKSGMDASFLLTLSRLWSNTWAEKTIFKVDCSSKGAYDKCLWQLQVDMISDAADNDVQWMTDYTQCTDGGDKPKCLPGMGLTWYGGCVPLKTLLVEGV